MRFFLLDTESTVVRDRWYSIPMPQDVIDRMNSIAARDTVISTATDQKEKRVTYRSALDHSDHPPPDAEVAGVVEPPPTLIPGSLHVEDPDTMPDILVPPADDVISSDSNAATDPLTSYPPTQPDGQSKPVVSPPIASRASRSREELTPVEQAVWTSHYNTRYRGALVPVTREQIHFCFNISIKRALAEFGNAAVQSIQSELSQMLSKKVWEPVSLKDLTHEQRRSIIRSHMFLKEKLSSNGSFEKLKARLVAGGDAQDRSVYTDISSPTVGLSAVFIVAAIAAQERREVITVDIAGAYLNADIGESVVLMRLDSQLSGLLLDIDPHNYEKFRNSDGSIVVRLKKALYRCIESAKLWFNLLASVLQDYGFKQNPHERCVFNMQIGAHQLTVVVYVDDLLITCADSAIADQFVVFIKKRFVTITEHRGHVHSYLGMTFNFGCPGKVAVTMEGYTNDLLAYAKVNGTVTSPATHSLFSHNPADEQLGQDEKEQFHTLVAKLLYLAKRVRPDVLTAVSVLTSRVQQPTVVDRQKLDRILKYLNGNQHFGIILEKRFDHPLAFVDASYGVHPDCKSQTGLFITLGLGPVFVRSSKQKLVAKSSTEAELIALSDSTGEILWVRNFLIGQGINKEELPATIYEDNMSTIALIDKGRSQNASTKHINIRYFFIKDRMDAKELKIEYKPTEDMIADIFTKALQGTLFKRLRGLLLNHDTEGLSETVTTPRD